MRKHILFKLFFFILGILTFASVSGFTPDDEQDLIELRSKLVQASFFDVKINLENDTVLLAIENRAYRSDAEALAVLIQLVDESIHTPIVIKVVFLKLGLPIMLTTVDLKEFQTIQDYPETIDEWKKYIKYSYDVKKEWKQLKGVDKINKRTFSTDLEIEPKIGFQLGDFEIPFRYEIYIYPKIKVNLWKGSYFEASTYTPVYNYEFVNEYYYTQPHIIALHQNFKLFQGNFLRLSTGIFTNRRYGLSAEYNSYLFNGLLTLHAEAGYTGRQIYVQAGHRGLYYTLYDRNVFEYTAPSYFTYKLGIDLKVPVFEVALSYTYGRYLFFENAHNVKIYRNFNEYIMGLEAYWDPYGRNFGFYVNFPLIPSKNINYKKIRLKPSKYLNYSYLATNDYYWYFRTGYNPDMDYFELNPRVLVNQLPMYLLLVYERKCN